MNTNFNLKIARLKKGKSQRLLAWEIGITQSTYSLIEQGFRQPKPDEIKKITKALDSNANELFPELEVN